MPKEKLPVLWGNNRWKLDNRGLIVPANRIKRSNPKWVDYGTLPGGQSSSLRDEAHQDSSLRVRFTNQLIDAELADNKACRSENPTCYITCGGTASGKTSAANLMLEVAARHQERFIRIDYDRYKRLLPEYEEVYKRAPKKAASYTHQESAKIAGKLFKKACQQGLNIVYEKTLTDPSHTEEEIRKLRKRRYRIVIISTHVSVEIGLKRANIRFKEGGRFVPEDKIREAYKKAPQSLRQLQSLVDEIILFDNHAARLRPLYISGAGGAVVVDQALYQAYINTVGNECSLI